MSMTDPGDNMIEALRRANPVPARQPEHRRALPSAHALFADIVTNTPPRGPRRARVRASGMIVAVVLIVPALVAFVHVQKDPPSLPTSVVCYSAADLGARRIVVGSAGDAAKACASVWSKGGFAGLGTTPRSGTGFDVCVLPTGVAAVFPGESGSVCSRLGLAQSSGGDENIPRFAAETDRRVSASCIGHDAAAQIIRSELEANGLSGWTIKRSARRFDAAHPCASIYVDAPARTVGIVPIANPYPSTTVTAG